MKFTIKSSSVKLINGINRKMTHTSEFFIVETESVDDKDKGETSRGTN